MCNACGFVCCASDEFEGCGCECDTPECEAEEVEEYFDGDDERDEPDWPGDDGPYGEEVYRVPAPLPRRYGFDLVTGVCSRPIRFDRRENGEPYRWTNGEPRFGHWRKHLWKVRGKLGAMYCRRCGEKFVPVPF